MGAFLGISAGTPAKYSSIVSQLLASCDQSPFAAQFLYNLMGPIFYELTMMALPSDQQSLATLTRWMDHNDDEVVAPPEIKLDTLIKFLCFVYFESALQSGATEDVFETLTFCDQYEVTELREYCTDSLKSLTESSYGHHSSSNNSARLFGKRLCDYVMLFLGGRIPFYFNEEELTLLHSVLIETILDVTYANRSEFDMAESGILWLQRKLMISPPARTIIVACPVAKKSRQMPRSSSSNLLLLLNILAICYNGVNIFVGGEEEVTDPVLADCRRDSSFQCGSVTVTMMMILCAIWTTVTWIRLWLNYCGHCHRMTPSLLYLISLDGDALESIIAAHQPVVVVSNNAAITHSGKGP